MNLIGKQRTVEQANEMKTLVRKMVEKDGNTLREAAGRLGISLSTATKYYRDARQYLDLSGPATPKELRAQKRREANR